MAAIPLSVDVDKLALERARHIAARLAIARPRHDSARRRGVGELRSVRYTGNSDDIDLEATLERIAGQVAPEDDDIVVRERSSIRRAIVLAVDVSGSMRGERIRTAAATVGALAGELRSDDLAVIAFWSDAAVLSSFGRPTPAPELIETLIRIPARGLTNVSFPLLMAGQQLAQVPVRDRRVLLLSDCVHNAGPDPRVAAGQLPRLDVLLDTSGEHDLDLARDLARVGRGRLSQARTFREVPAALARLLD